MLIFGDTKTPKNNQEIPWNIFKPYPFYKSQKSGTPNNVKFRKYARQKNMKIRHEINIYQQKHEMFVFKIYES